MTREFFLNPQNIKQKQYEALRAYYVEGMTQKEVAERFGYALSTVQTLVKIFKHQQAGFFVESKKGPKDRQTPLNIREQIVLMRNKSLSIEDIRVELEKKEISLSSKTIERILKDYGFGKLCRRTNDERGLTKNKSVIPEKTKQINFEEIKKESFGCIVIGIYFFMPYLITTRFYDLISNSSLPGNQQLTKLNYNLSVLLLKLVGIKRLSHISDYSFDRGFGLFAGLNVLPKSTAISTYSYLIDKEVIVKLQKEFVSCLYKIKPHYYSGKTINLDFHTIPHYGEDTPLENNWESSRNKVMKSALTFLAQDSESKMLAYTSTDIKRKNASNEILNFTDYWISIKGIIDQMLVFDSRLTNYEMLNQLNEKSIKFLTLRRRSNNLIKWAYNLPNSEWTKIKLDVPKRKYNKFLAYDHETKLSNYAAPIREIVIKEHGRIEPTFIVTNNFDLQLDDAVLWYARRWRIENKISELVDFFNLNALSSPLMIRIYYDIFMTMVAEILYRMFAEDLKGFENHTPESISRKFIDHPGKIAIDQNAINIKMRKVANTPILKGSVISNKTYNIPWLNNRKLKFDFVP